MFGYGGTTVILLSLSKLSHKSEKAIVIINTYNNSSQFDALKYDRAKLSMENILNVAISKCQKIFSELCAQI